jgi:U4/U6.U5 tri-snRNP component SNU23
MADKKTAGAANFTRRTWDAAEYARRALERAEREAPGGAGSAAAGGRGGGAPSAPGAGALTVRDGPGEAAPYRDAAPGAAGPEGSKRSYLQAREYDLQLEAKVNKRKVVTDSTPLSQTGGYFCELCQCSLTDSSTYLDHINGTKHQRRLGVSMRVEAASVDAVRERLQAAKQRQEGAAHAARAEAEHREALAEFEGRVSAAAAEEAARKRARKEQRRGGEGGGGGGGGGGGSSGGGGGGSGDGGGSATAPGGDSAAAAGSSGGGGGSDAANGGDAGAEGGDAAAAAAAAMAAMLGFSSFS